MFPNFSKKLIKKTRTQPGSNPDPLDSRHETGNHRLRVREQLHQGKVDDALMRFEKFERKIENVEGRVEAFALGERPDLRQEIQNLEGEEKVEQALKELKQRMRGSDSKEDGKGDAK